MEFTFWYLRRSYSQMIAASTISLLTQRNQAADHLISRHRGTYGAIEERSIPKQIANCVKSPLGKFIRPPSTNKTSESMSFCTHGRLTGHQQVELGWCPKSLLISAIRCAAGVRFQTIKSSPDDA